MNIDYFFFFLDPPFSCWRLFRMHFFAESVFTPKEQQEIEELEKAMHDPKLSKIEQQIAEAKLQDIRASKGESPSSP